MDQFFTKIFIKFFLNRLLKFCLIVSIYTICTNAFAQKQANIWYFGNGIGLDFNTTPPTQLTRSFTGQHFDDTDEGHATVSDENGNFLFYTNGESVWDKNGAVMQNGSGLLGHWSAAQCATIFPMPGNTKTADKAKYVVFTTPFSDNNLTVNYSVVNLDTTFATGAVTNVKNAVPPGGPSAAAEALVSCPHFNGNDVWVVAHDKNSPSATHFYAWKISSNAAGNIVVSAPVVSNIGDALNYGWPYYGISMMKFNNCFNRLFVNYYGGSTAQGFKFDNATGIVSNWPAPVSAVLKLDLSKVQSGSTGAAIGNYGLEFSPSGQYIYIGQSGEDNAGVKSQRLYRYDLNAGNQTAIESSRLTLLDRQGTAGSERLGHLQLAPNGKIYATHMYTFYQGDGKLSVINNPDNASPGFSLETITWTGKRSSMGLPSFHKGFLAGNASLSAVDSTSGTSISNLGEICQGISTVLESKYTSTGSSYVWDVDAPGGVQPNQGKSADGTKAYHRYTTTGNHLVVIAVTDAVCGYVVRDTARITVNPNINTTAGYTCTDPNINLFVNSPGAGKKYVWYTDAALTQAISIGPTLTRPQPNSTLYVKEVATAVSNSVMTDPGSPAITAGTSIISSLPSPANYNPSYTAYPAGTPAKNYLVVSNTVALNSFKFVASGSWGSPATGVFGIRITNTTTSSVVYVNNSYTGNLIKGNPQLSGNQVGWVTFTPAAAINLAPGNYMIEIWKTTAGTELDLYLFTDLLTNPAITNLISNTGNGASKSFISDISVTYGAVAAVPPTYTNVITTTPLACSNAGKITTNCILPVDFLYVKANPNRVITWATSREVNNNYFIVERSVDGKTFTEIGRVNGSGNSNNVSTYSFTDNVNSNYDSYYRIIQVDFNGNPTYSNVVVLRSENVNIVSIYPNPNNGEFTISVNLDNEASLYTEVLNSIGIVVYTTELKAGKSVNPINLSHLPKGAYIVRTTGESSISINKLIVE